MKEVIKNWYEQKMGISRMQEKLFKKFGKEIDILEIKSIINELKDEGVSYDKYSSRDIERSDGGLKDLVSSVGDDRGYKYIPETGHVVLDIDGSPYPVLVSTIDSMIEKYSRHGDSQSGQQIQYQFGITPRVWNIIKNRFGIYKESTPFSIVTLMDIDEGELSNVAEQKAKKLVESRMSKIYIDAANRLKESKFKKFAKAQMGHTIFLEQLDDIVARYKKREIITKQPRQDNNDNYMCFITDAHIGKNGTAGIIKRFAKITGELMARPERRITIVFGGDIGELFTGSGIEMHPGQKLGMEDISTAELVMLCVDVLEYMLSELHNSGKKVMFKAVLGNHDRITQKKEYDPFRTAGRIIHSFLQKIFKDTDVNIDILGDKHNIFTIGNIKYVVMHGDGLSPAELNRIAIKEVESKKYLCIISGDKHHLAMKEISDNVMWIQAPALSGPGRYDKSLAMSSLSGYLGFKTNPDGLLDIGIHRLS